jgi:hypothetical protein
VDEAELVGEADADDDDAADIEVLETSPVLSLM